MGKQTDAIVYYCDKCRKSVIGTPAILKEAECLATAHGMLKDEDIQLKSFPFSVNAMNKFFKPTITTDAREGEVVSDGVMATMDLKIEPEIIYLCQECADKIAQTYIEKCNEINELFD